MSGPPSPFIEKLQNILNVNGLLIQDPKNSEIIQFDQEAGRLEIVNKKEMERILPIYFRHGRFQSFVRQLNWYGFYKTNNKLSHSYSHPDLEKGIELSSIKSRRKHSKPKQDQQEIFSHNPITTIPSLQENNNKSQNFSFFFSYPQDYLNYFNFHRTLPDVQPFQMLIQNGGMETQNVLPMINFSQAFV